MDKRKVDVIDIWLAISGGDIHLTSTIRSLMNAIVARARILKNIQEYSREFENIQENSRIFKNIQEYMACNIRRQYPLDLRHPISYMYAIVAKARIFNNIQEYSRMFKNIQEGSRMFKNIQDYMACNIPRH